MVKTRIGKGSMEPPLKREGVRSRTSCWNQEIGKGNKETNYQKEHHKEQVATITPGKGLVKRLQRTGAGKKDKKGNEKGAHKL